MDIGLFHFLTIVNNVNMGVQMPVPVSAFNFWGDITRSRIAESNGILCLIF